ncbi:hypothetical protein H0H92_002035, partial [Tricholoma furcatifolium]
MPGSWRRRASIALSRTYLALEGSSHSNWQIRRRDHRGAKAYGYGCMKRVGIAPTDVSIMADDKHLKAGKPARDPFSWLQSASGTVQAN